MADLEMFKFSSPKWSVKKEEARIVHLIALEISLHSDSGIVRMPET